MNLIKNRYKIIVNWGDCDPAGIVFYPNFYKWMDEAHWHYFKKIDQSILELKKQYKIIGLPLLKTSGIYYKPCKQGDTLEIETRLIELNNSSLRLQHIIYSKDLIASIGYETRIWAKKKGTKISSHPIPGIIKDVLLKYLKDEIII